MQDVTEEFNEDRNSEKNKNEILEMNSSINQILKPQLKVSTVDWVKLKTEYQDLKTR
jgi:hypothetical protein